jgi:pilus assembly protein CpaF
MTEIKLNLKRIIPFGILLLISVIVALYGVISLGSSAIFLINGEEGPGSVSIGPGTRVNLVFYDRNGNSHVAQFKHIFSGNLSEREQVPVLYNPTSPSSATINNALYMWLPGFIFLLFGLLVSFVSIFLMDIPFLRNTKAGSHSGGVQEKQNQSTYQNEKTSSGHSSSLSATHNSSVSSDLFGLLTPLIEDKDVTDIIIESASAVFTKKGNTITKSSIVFPSQVKYEQLVERLLTQADTSYTISKPIVDGMVTPLVRIHAVHKVLCETGPYVTLRVSRVSSVTYQEFCRATMAPREIIAYLRAMLLTGNTILVAGEVGTGKTTLLRALASTIPKNESILVIEDTSEINIEHPTVRYVRTRESNTEGVGKVSPGECIRAGMRMAMNRIIFGEIRDPEAAESFIDVCVSGHPGMSTVHAKSAEDAISRLELLLARQQPGVERSSLRQQICSAVQVVAYAQICKHTGQRRITEVIEIDCDQKNVVRTQEIFRYGVSGSMPFWQVKNRKSFFQEGLREFEGGYTLESLPDVLSVQTK